MIRVSYRGRMGRTARRHFDTLEEALAEVADLIGEGFEMVTVTRDADLAGGVPGQLGLLDE